MAENNVAGVIGALIVGCVMLFIGLYLVNITASLQSPSYYYDYGYTTATNTSTQTLNVAANATHSLTIGTIVSITGEATPTSNLLFNVTSAAAAIDYNVSVYLNDIYLNKFVITHGTTEQNTISSVAWVTGSVNVLTYETEAPAGNLTTLKSYGTYPSSQVPNSFGSIFDITVTMTGTIFTILGLIIIVAALGVAIKSLQSSA